SENVAPASEDQSALGSGEGQQVWVEDGGFIASNTEVPDDAYEIEVMANLPDLAAEVTVVPDLDDALGNPFQQEFWSVLKGLWATPDTPTGDITSALDDAHEETLND
ncbi:carbohydrate ABC transporter substrate-binding protein, partial [Haloarcula sp. AONF1]